MRNTHSRVFILIGTAVAVVVLPMMGCSSRATQSSKKVQTMLQTMKTAAEENPAGMAALTYVESVVFIQQLVDKKKKDIELLEHAVTVALNFLDAHPNDKYGRLNMARLYFQMASYWNSKSHLIKATKNVQKGLGLFTALRDEYPADVLVRAYAVVNAANLPRIFDQGNVIDDDSEALLIVINDPATVDELTRYEVSVLISALTAVSDFYDKSKNSDAKNHINAAVTRLTDIHDAQVAGAAADIPADIQRMSDAAQNGTVNSNSAETAAFLQYVRAVADFTDGGIDAQNGALIRDVLNAINEYAQANSVGITPGQPVDTSTLDVLVLQARLYMQNAIYHSRVEDDPVPPLADEYKATQLFEQLIAARPNFIEARVYNALYATRSPMTLRQNITARRDIEYIRAALNNGTVPSDFMPVVKTIMDTPFARKEAQQ